MTNSYLAFVRDSHSSVWGSLAEAEEQGIRRAVELARPYPGPIVEIGALFGHTTNLLATLKRTDVALIAVENFTWNPFHMPPEIHRVFTNRTLRYALDHCSTEVFDGDAEAFYAASQALRPSLVFIDANHDHASVRRDIDWAVTSGCPVVSGHDFSGSHPGVVRAVGEVFGDDVELHHSVWIHHSGRGS